MEDGSPHCGGYSLDCDARILDCGPRSPKLRTFDPHCDRCSPDCNTRSPPCGVCGPELRTSPLAVASAVRRSCCAGFLRPEIFGAVVAPEISGARILARPLRR